jgi:hypothetical protein
VTDTTDDEGPPIDGEDAGNVVNLEKRRKEEKHKSELETFATDLVNATAIALTKTDTPFFNSSYLINGYVALVNEAKNNVIIKARLLKIKDSISKHQNPNIKFVFESAVKEAQLEIDAAKQRKLAELRENQINLKFDEYEEGKYASYDKNGAPLKDIINCQLALKHLGVDAKFNEFRGEPSWVYKDGPVDTNQIFNLVYELTRVQWSIEQIETALITYARRRTYHPVKEYFDSIKDLEPKNIIENWMTPALGAVDNQLNREIGKKMLLAMVTRCYRPGAKFDQMVILEGPQGIGKSSILEMLASTEFFNSGSLFTEDKPMAQTEAVKGILLYESADLAGHKRADVDKVKAFLSKTNDRGRWVYERRVQDYPRTCIIVGTTNPKNYLIDETGNRRFWPVVCGVVPTAKIINGVSHADLAWMKQNRDQLWAEALRLYYSGYSLELPSELWGEVAALQSTRMVEVPGIERIPDVFGMYETEGLNVYGDDPKHFLYELRIYSKDIIDHLFPATNGNTSIGRTVRTAMLAYNSLEHGLRWEADQFRIRNQPQNRGYKMEAKGKEQYDCLKSVVEEAREARRQKGIGGAGNTM